MPNLMKGHKWRDHAKKMTYPAWVEIKSDEIRCEVIVTPHGTWDVQFLSYAGKPLANMAAFAIKFQQLARDTGIIHFDVGIEVNGNFNDSYRWCRATKTKPADLDESMVRFWLFDLPDHEGSFHTRCTQRHNVAVASVECGLHMAAPYGEWAYKPDDVERMFVKARELGHEGLMVKSTEHRYEAGKRSYGWLKVKPEDDEDGIITAVHRAYSEAGTPLDRAGSVSVEMPDGSTADPHGIGHDLGRHMLAHPEEYIGKWCEFKYMERDRKGGYRHPTWNRIREEKA